MVRGQPDEKPRSPQTTRAKASVANNLTTALYVALGPAIRITIVSKRNDIEVLIIYRLLFQR